MDNKILKKGVEVIRDGGIVIYPTDTAFGIGCRIDYPRVVDRLFKIRARPLTQAMPVLVDSIEMALPYLFNPPSIVRHLMNQYWPGALTIVTKVKQNLFYSPIRGGGGNIGFRMPNHVIPLTLTREIGVPILGPSANFHGFPTPFAMEDLDPNLVKLADLVIPGNCSLGNVSTIVDCSVDPYKIIRQGAVTL